jgi:hypothetical protein
LCFLFAPNSGPIAPAAGRGRVVFPRVSPVFRALRPALIRTTKPCFADPESSVFFEDFQTGDAG